MPRSRSMSLESMTRSATSWLARNTPLCFKQLIHQGGLAVVNVCDDGNISDIFSFCPHGIYTPFFVSVSDLVTEFKVVSTLQFITC